MISRSVRSVRGQRASAAVRTLVAGGLRSARVPPATVTQTAHRGHLSDRTLAPDNNLPAFCDCRRSVCARIRRSSGRRVVGRAAVRCAATWIVRSPRTCAGACYDILSRSSGSTSPTHWTSTSGRCARCSLRAACRTPRS